MIPRREGAARAATAGIAVALAVAGCAGVDSRRDSGSGPRGEVEGSATGGSRTARGGDREETAMPTATATEKTRFEMVLLPEPASPVAVIRAVFRTGSASDPPGKEGLASIAATLLAEGGTKDLAYPDLLRRLYPMAADVGVLVERDLTTFVGEAPSEKLDEFYPLFRDVLLAPRFDEADFRRILQDHRDHLTKTLRGNNDEELGKAALQGMLYAGHPYGHELHGTVASLETITLDDVKAFVAREYSRGALVLGLAGGYGPEFPSRVERDLAALPAGGTPHPPLPAPRRPEGLEFLLVEKDAPATAVSIGFPIDVTRTHPDYYALRVAVSALGEHRTFNGRLMQRMRRDRGLNYGDYAYLEHFVQEGGSTFVHPNLGRRQQYFSVWIRPVPHDKRLFAIRQAIRELEIWVEEGLSPDEFEQTRKFLLHYSKLWVQSASRRLGYAIDGRLHGARSEVDEFAERLPRITLEDVNGAIRRNLRSTDLHVAVVTKDGASLRDEILSGAPSPLVYDTEGTKPEIVAEDAIIEVHPLRVATPIEIRPVEAMFEK